MRKAEHGELRLDKGAAKAMVEVGAEKLADKKCAPAVREMLT